MDITSGEISLANLGRINVIVGKNGCGKSSLLREVSDLGERDRTNIAQVTYVTPERGGVLIQESSIETQLTNNPSWGSAVRRSNRQDSFRQMAFTEYRNLEMLVLRALEADYGIGTNKPRFIDMISKINSVLDRVEIYQSAERMGLNVRNKGTYEHRDADTLSSGEKELITIAIEIIAFVFKASHPDNAGRTNLLLLDEPDAHLHPDLQVRLMKLLEEETRDKPVVTIIATHSTSILGALSSTASVAFMKDGDKHLTFQTISEALEKVLPIFGAHPLSNVFQETPILLVEGEDDTRIWQQVVRSSLGRVRIWPCDVGDIQSLDDYENTASNIIGSIYDNAKGFSLRDRDDDPYDISDKEHIVRMRLNCRTAENLILADDTLSLLETSWDDVKQNISDWLQSRQGDTSKQYLALSVFAEGGFDRKNAVLKEARNLLMVFAGSAKPWEVAVGQAIAKLTASSPNSDQSLKAYLGDKLVRSLNLAI